MATGKRQDDEAELRALLSRQMLENRVRAVLHRWYTFYEREPRDIERQFELITEDFTLVRPPESGMAGTMRGRDEYAQSLRELPAGARHSHWLHSFELHSIDARTATATVRHRYQTIGPLRSGAALLKYELTLADDGVLLPRFASLKEQVVAMLKEPFEDAYAENRAAAFVYQWMAVLERLDGNYAPLHELVADDAVLEASSGQSVRGRDAAVRVLSGLGAQVQRSAHRIGNLKITAAADHAYRVEMDTMWEGIDKAGTTALVAHTQHDWTLVETGARYPVLRELRARALEPYTPVSFADAIAHHQRPF